MAGCCNRFGHRLNEMGTGKCRARLHRGDWSGVPAVRPADHIWHGALFSSLPCGRKIAPAAPITNTSPWRGEVGRASGPGGGDSPSTYAAWLSPHPGLPSAVQPSPFRGGWPTALTSASGGRGSCWVAGQPHIDRAGASPYIGLPWHFAISSFCPTDGCG